MPSSLDRSDADYQRIVLRFQQTALRVAHAWGKTSDTREEAESDCYLKLCELVKVTPDENLNEPYVAESLRNSLRNVHKASKRLKRTADFVYLDAPLEGSDSSGDELSGHDFIADHQAVNPEAAAISAIFVHQMLAKLPQRQRKVLSRMAGLEGMDPTPITRIAKQLHISRDTAHEDLKAAVATLRGELTMLGLAPAGNDRAVVEVLRNAA